MDRSFDVLEKAASNENAMGCVTNMGMELGMGISTGNQIGSMLSQNINTNIIPPPLPQTSVYYIVVNCQQQGPFDQNTITSYINVGQINSETLVWKQGMHSWARISTLIEFAQLFQNNCPPPIPPTSKIDM